MSIFENNKTNHSNTCSLCGEKVKLLDRNYVHILSDGTLCQKCHMSLQHFIYRKNCWVDSKEYMSVIQGNYDYRAQYCLPLEKAQALLRLRDTVCDRFLESIELDNGDVFVVQEIFQMPKNPAIFILRSLKVRNKAVLQGFTLKGKIKKGDNIKLKINDNLQTVTALDVVPKGTDPFSKSTFFNNLETNIHNHTIDEGREGWIIIDFEDYNKINSNTFVAKYL